MALPDVKPGDRVLLRKGHPCGANDWLVLRIGTDIGLKCTQCGRKVMLQRSKFNKSFKRFLSRAGETDGGSVSA